MAAEVLSRLGLEDDKAILNFWLQEDNVDFKSAALWEKLRDELRVKHKCTELSTEEVKQRWIQVIDQYMGLFFGVELVDIKDNRNEDDEMDSVEILQARLIELKQLIGPFKTWPKKIQTAMPVQCQIFTNKTFFVLRDLTNFLDCIMADSHVSLIMALGGLVVNLIEETTSETIIISCLSSRINRRAYHMFEGNLYDYHCIMDVIVKTKQHLPYSWIDYILTFDISDGEESHDEEVGYEEEEEQESMD